MQILTKLDVILLIFWYMGFKLVQTSDSSQRGYTVSHACFLQVTDSEVSDVVQGLLQIGAIMFILLVTQFFTKLKIKKKKQANF